MVRPVPAEPLINQFRRWFGRMALGKSRSKDTRAPVRVRKRASVYDLRLRKYRIVMACHRPERPLSPKNSEKGRRFPF